MKSARRIVLKKGRIIVTKNPEFVLYLANQIYKKLKLLSNKISFAGSIRRKSLTPVDIDIVLIPKDKEKIKQVLKKEGKLIFHGDKKVGAKIDGVKVEIYFATENDWGAMLFYSTGPSGLSIGLRILARKNGMLLNQYGLFKKGKLIASKTEKEIYFALGKKYKNPEER
jgi:DNA polymerase (family 10)